MSEMGKAIGKVTSMKNFVIQTVCAPMARPKREQIAFRLTLKKSFVVSKQFQSKLILSLNKAMNFDQKIINFKLLM